MAEALARDEEQWDWLTRIETRLEELMMLKASPEKQVNRTKKQQ